MKARGRLRLVVRSAADAVEERRAENIVLRQGATLVARLFAGQATGAPIDQIGVGFGREAAEVEASALTPPSGAIPADALRGAIAADSFTISTDQPRVVVVSIAARFQPTVELPDVSEAGLLADGQLYNQVVFEPVTLRPGQEVTFFWDVEFPFGH